MTKPVMFLLIARNNCSAKTLCTLTHCWGFFINTLSNFWCQSEKKEMISCHFTAVFATTSETKQIQVVTNRLISLGFFFSQKTWSPQEGRQQFICSLGVYSVILGGPKHLC